MRLSSLQKFILLETYFARSKKISRTRLKRFYEKYKKPLKDKMIVKIITKSLERLIDKELIVGYGIRTPHKWYIKEVRLTPLGRKVTKKLLGEQMALPFKKPKIKNKKHK